MQNADEVLTSHDKMTSAIVELSAVYLVDNKWTKHTNYNLRDTIAKWIVNLHIYSRPNRNFI